MASRTVSIILTGNNAGAVKALGGVEAAAAKAGTGAAEHMGKSAGKIGVAFHALDQQLSAFGVPFAGTFGIVGSTLEHAENKTKSFGSTLSKIGQVELTAAIVGVAAIGSEAVHLADDLEKAHAREETAIKNAGGSYEEYRGAIEKTKSQMEKFGFTNAETETSLANLTNATHDAGKAIDLQSLAADIARGRNIGLAEATNILMKVETGHVQLLGRLGINVKDANGQIISQEEAIRRLSATYKGQAAAAADTFAGKMKTLSTTVQDVGAKLGETLVPKVEAVASGLSTGITKFEDFNSTLDGVPGKVLAITAAAPAAVFAIEKLGAGAKGVKTAFEKIGDGVSSAIRGIGRLTGIGGEIAGAEEVDTVAIESNTAATAANTTAKISMVYADEAKVAAANASAAATLDQEAAYAGLTGTLDGATVATHALTEADTEQIAVWAALTGEEEANALALTTLKTAELETAASSGILASTTAALGSVFGTVGGALTALTAGLLAGKLAGDKINSVLDGTKPNVDQLAKAFTFLGQTNQVAGKASSQFGGDLSGLAHAMDKLGGVHIPGTSFDYLRSGARQAKAAIDATNQALESVLAVSGPQTATLAFARIRDRLIALGEPVDKINKDFGPFLGMLNDKLPAAATTAGGSIQSLGSVFSDFAKSLDKAETGLKIADSLDAIRTAAEKVAADKADLAGTSDKATNANRAEAAANRGLSDSYDGLHNAQQGVSSAAQGLLQAQQALDQYNSARGIKERSLQLDIIRRRVVTTPAESDQKQLDLLQFDDTNAAKKQQLQDAVIAGQKSLASAEHGVVTATQSVKDAQQGVVDAVKARRAVHDDAAKAIAGDERKVKEAVNSTVTLMQEALTKGQLNNAQLKAWSGLLDVVANTYAPGSDLSKNVDTFYKKLIKAEQDAGLQASIDKAGDSAFNPPGSTKGRGSTHNPQPPTAHTLGLLHELGVSGFAEGGVVPGAVGAPRLAVVHGGERILTVEQAKTVPEQPARHTHQLAAPQASSAAHSATSVTSNVTLPASRTDTSSFQKIETALRSDRSTSSRSLINDKKTSSLTEKLIDRKTDRAVFHQTVPALATGGPVDPRKPHLVGEKGPELFVPKVAGTIVPNHKISGAPSATAAAVPRPVVQHNVNAPQTINFYGAQTATLAELEFLNRDLGWRLSRTGRSG